MARPRISVLIHTRNEAEAIVPCLASVAWADEVVVADMASVDATCELALARGARVVAMPLAQNVDEVRNLGLTACTGEWLFVVDADEVVTQGLATRVRQLVESGTSDGYWIPRRNQFLKVWLDHCAWPDRQLRLFRRGHASWSGLVHEPPRVEGKVEKLEADPAIALEHHADRAGLTVLFQKLAKYSELELRRIPEMTPADTMLFLLRSPAMEFFGRYFRGGWRDGMAGLMYCLLRGVYQAMIALQLHAQRRSRFAAPAPHALRLRMRWELVRTGLKALIG